MLRMGQVLHGGFPTVIFYFLNAGILFAGTTRTEPAQDLGRAKPRCEFDNTENPKQLRFIDKDGRVIKEIPRLHDACRGTRRGRGNRFFLGCNTGEFAVAIIQFYKCEETTGEGVEGDMGPWPISTEFQFYDSNGKKLWSRHAERSPMPTTGSIKVAPNDRGIAYVEYKDETSLFVMDEKGKARRILIQDADVPNENFYFSPNGRFVWVKGLHPTGPCPARGWPQ